MSDAVITLISPFNGGKLMIPPDFPRDTLAALEERGFTRVEPEPESVPDKPTKAKGQKS